MQSPSFDSRPWDHLAWLWLALGAILSPFAHIQTVWPIAAWLYPVFLMRFGRTQRLAIGLPLIVVAQCLATAIGMRNDYTRLPVGPLLAGAALAYGLLFSLPFVADRLLAARLSGGLRTLVYPLTAVTIDYLLLFTPFNTFGSPAYTQYGDLPLMQLVSLTGIWGLTFLISWLAPVVNEVWENGASPRVLRDGVLPFVLVSQACWSMAMPGFRSRPGAGLARSHSADRGSPVHTPRARVAVPCGSPGPNAG